MSLRLSSLRGGSPSGGKGRGLQDLPSVHLQGCWLSLLPVGLEHHGLAGGAESPTAVASPEAGAPRGDRGGSRACSATHRLSAFGATERLSCSNIRSVQVL